MPRKIREKDSETKKLSSEAFLFMVFLTSLAFLYTVSTEASIPDPEKLVSIGEYSVFLALGLGLANGFKKALEEIQNNGKEKSKRVGEFIFLAAISSLLLLVLPYISQLDPEFIRQPIKLKLELGKELEIPFPLTTALAYIICFTSLSFGVIFHSILKKK